MPRNNKRSGVLANARTVKARKQVVEDNYYKKVRKWDSALEDWEVKCQSLYNPKGHSRTYEETALMLLLLKAKLQALVDDRSYYDISWTKLEEMVAMDLKVDVKHVRQARKVFDQDGCVIVADTSTRGRGSANYDQSIYKKITIEHLTAMVVWVDKQHSKGETVTNQRVRNWFRTTYQIEISKTRVSRHLNEMGLRWRSAKPKRRTVAEYRTEVLTKFLLGVDQYLKGEDNYVFVYTDESYIHNTHAMANSYFDSKESRIDRSASKGRRLCIMHAITKDGPITELDSNGFPVSDLKWVRDTPHPTPRDDGKLTCETLWCADSNTGDYHKNLTSDIFMRWLKDKLIPCFKRLYGNKKMVLIADNAPYHHKRAIGTLSSLKKTELVTLMIQYDVEYIDVPLTPKRMEALEDVDIDGVTDLGDGYRIEFDGEVFQQRSTSPFVPTLNELQLGFAAYLRDNNPQALECLVERCLKDEGYDVLWTPPYTPDLQPIETYWAIGKNRVAENYYNGRSMKTTVEQLREAWYGNETMANKALCRIVQPANCSGITQKAISIANKRFIPLCPDLRGELGSLEATNTVGSSADFPIDLVVADYGAITIEDTEDTEDTVVDTVVDVDID